MIKRRIVCTVTKRITNSQDDRPTYLDSNTLPSAVTSVRYDPEQALQYVLDRERQPIVQSGAFVYR